MLCFVFAALIVVLDQFIKRWVLLTIDLYGSMELIPGVIGLTRYENTGAALGILAGQRWLLIGVAFIAALLLIAILLRYNEGFWGTLGLAAVLGGTVGNLIDRISYGHVVDMFDLQFMRFAIFNIADIFITLGGLTFLIYFIVSTVKPPKAEGMIYEVASVEDSLEERPFIEDEIGLYDFNYGDDSYDTDQYEYDASLDTESILASIPGVETKTSATFVETEQSIDSYIGPPADVTSALEALSELELELQESGALDDYDLDDLLKEYGFEDDTD